MGGINKKKLTIGAIVLAIIVFAVWQVTDVMTSAEPLTVEEATNKVQDLYKGKIVEVKEGKQAYQIIIELDTGTYEIEIDRESGDIESMERTKKIVVRNDQTTDDAAGKSQETPQPEEPAGTTDSQEKSQPKPPASATNPNEGVHATPKEEKQPTPPAAPKPEKTTPKETAKQLTEAEAVAIALNQLNGEVDDVEFVQSGGVSYYLVEIEREDDEEEGTIQVNAISGEVMSIIWDD